jgi:hypothetical protein
LNVTADDGEGVDEERRLRQLVDVELIAVEDWTPRRAVLEVCLDEALLQVWAGEESRVWLLLGEETLFLIAGVGLDLELVVSRREVAPGFGIVGAASRRGTAGVVANRIKGRVEGLRRMGGLWQRVGMVKAPDPLWRGFAQGDALIGGVLCTLFDRRCIHRLCLRRLSLPGAVTTAAAVWRRQWTASPRNPFGRPHATFFAGRVAIRAVAEALPGADLKVASNLPGQPRCIWVRPARDTFLL